MIYLEVDVNVMRRKKRECLLYHFVPLDQVGI